MPSWFGPTLLRTGTRGGRAHAAERDRYHGAVPRRPRSLIQRIRDQLGFSLVTLLVLFVVLRALGLRATVSAFLVSLMLTIGVNVALSYWHDHRARREAERGLPHPPADGDIRWRKTQQDRHR